MLNEIRNSFLEHFGAEPHVTVRSPGRINLIGEHTDYNGGFVLPASINRSIILAFSPRKDNEMHLVAYNMNESPPNPSKGGALFTCSLDDRFVPPLEGGGAWSDYIKGAVEQIRNRDIKITGFNCAFGGDIPIGAGLSSSAALECGIIFGLCKLFNLPLTSLDIVLMGQATENEFVGMNCGVMDQFANVFGKKACMIKLDCENLAYEYVLFMSDDFDIVLCDSGIRHSLMETEYNVRRKECEAGVAVIHALYPHVTNLRRATLQQLEQVKNDISEIIYKRCKYVIEEIERVILAVKDLEKNNFAAFGRKMYATHDGLKNEYEVSCEELDFLVDEARKHDFVAGARMMGGGFGGCSINLVQKNHTKQFIAEISEAYKSAYGKTPQCHAVNITDGTSLIPHSLQEKI